MIALYTTFNVSCIYLLQKGIIYEDYRWTPGLLELTSKTVLPAHLRNNYCKYVMRAFSNVTSREVNVCEGGSPTPHPISLLTSFCMGI
jgi:hypothetical protein